MANKRITELGDIGTPSGSDVLEIVDVSDTTDSPEGTSKKVLVSALGGGGGAVSSVNGDTGAVVVDLESVLTEGGTATDLFIELGNSSDDNKVNIDGNSGSILFYDSVTNESLGINKSIIQRNKGGFQSNIAFTDPTANNVIEVQDGSGVLAFLSDITGGVSDGDKGDITVSGGGTVWNIDAGAVGNTEVASGIDAVKLADGSVSNTELQYINSLSSNAQTQLDAKAIKSTSAHSIKVNNTNATADETEIPFRQSGQGAYTETPTFTAGTAPSGSANMTYNWERIGNWVKINIIIDYSVAGATVTQIILPIPSDVPNPVVPTGFTGASVVLYTGNGHAGTGLTIATASSSDMFSFVRRNAGDTAFEFGISAVTASYRVFRMTLEYPVS